MIKRPFFTVTQPRLTYDLVETDPKEPQSVPVPPKLILLVNDSIDTANTNVATLKEAFIERFGRLPTKDLELMDLTSSIKGASEAYEDFGEKIKRKADRIQMGDQAISFFVRGIPRDVGVYVMGRNPKNIREAVKAANTDSLAYHAHKTREIFEFIASW